MLNYIFRCLIIPMIMLIGCSDDDSQAEIADLISFTTSNMNIADVFINLETNEEVSNESAWHLSIQKDTSNYNMPSIVFNNVQVALFEDLSFENINDFPKNFSDITIDYIDSFGYNGAHEVLSYDMAVHQVSVSNSDFVYILKSQNENTYKLQFLDYQSGITVFHYKSLN